MNGERCRKEICGTEMEVTDGNSKRFIDYIDRLLPGEQCRAQPVSGAVPVPRGVQEDGDRGRHGGGDHFRYHDIFPGGGGDLSVYAGAAAYRVSADDSFYTCHCSVSAVCGDVSEEVYSFPLSVVRDISAAYHDKLCGARRGADECDKTVRDFEECCERFCDGGGIYGLDCDPGGTAGEDGLQRCAGIFQGDAYCTDHGGPDGDRILRIFGVAVKQCQRTAAYYIGVWHRVEENIFLLKKM